MSEFKKLLEAKDATIRSLYQRIEDLENELRYIKVSTVASIAKIPDLDPDLFTPQELKFLTILYRHESEYVDRERLYRTIYGLSPKDGGPDDKVLDVIIFKLRKKLRENLIPWGIMAGYRVGYALLRIDEQGIFYPIGSKFKPEPVSEELWQECLSAYYRMASAIEMQEHRNVLR